LTASRGRGSVTSKAIPLRRWRTPRRRSARPSWKRNSSSRIRRRWATPRAALRSATSSSGPGRCNGRSASPRPTTERRARRSGGMGRRGRGDVAGEQAQDATQVLAGERSEPFVDRDDPAVCTPGVSSSSTSSHWATPSSGPRRRARRAPPLRRERRAAPSAGVLQERLIEPQRLQAPGGRRRDGSRRATCGGRGEGPRPRIVPATAIFIPGEGSAMRRTGGGLRSAAGGDGGDPPPCARRPWPGPPRACGPTPLTNWTGPARFIRQFGGVQTQESTPRAHSRSPPPLAAE